MTFRSWLAGYLTKRKHTQTRPTRQLHPLIVSDELPMPEPEQIFALRVLIPEKSDRSPSDMMLYVMYQLGAKNALNMRLEDAEKRRTAFQEQETRALASLRLPRSPLRDSKLSGMLAQITGQLSPINVGETPAPQACPIPDAGVMTPRPPEEEREDPFFEEEGDEDLFVWTEEEEEEEWVNDTAPRRRVG